MAVDCMAAVQPATFATMYSEFARAIRGDECSTPDVQRGLGIQRLLAEAELALRS
jgi:hypothetical protein